METCRNFTGYDSGRPTLEDDYSPDIVRMLHMIQEDDNGDIRAMRHMSGKMLLKAATVKLYSSLRLYSARYGNKNVL